MFFLLVCLETILKVTPARSRCVIALRLVFSACTYMYALNLCALQQRRQTYMHPLQSHYYILRQLRAPPAYTGVH